MIAESQIKGLVFATCRRFVEESFGDDGYARVSADLDARVRAAFEDPEVSELYPEAYMHAFVTQMHACPGGGR